MEIRTELIKANGLTFEVDICGSGDKFAICLHGFPESSYSWRHQIPMLVAQGYTVWAPNLRGYGNSSRPKKVKDYLLANLMDDVAQLIDAAGAKSTLLIAHDWGAIIAWQFAIEKKRPLSGLVIMNVPHPLDFEEGLKTFKQIRKSWYMIFFQIPKLPEFLLSRGKARMVGQAFLQMAVDKSRFPKEDLQVYRDNALKPGALTAMVNYYRANMHPKSMEAHLEAAKNKITTPTLMIWGEKDLALGKELTYGTNKRVEDFTLRYLPDVSHWVQQEAPETVNVLMETWLSGKTVPEVGAGGKIIPA